MLLTIVAFFFLVGDPTRSLQEISITFSKLLPPDTYKIVANYITATAAQRPKSLFWFSLAGTLWTASGMMLTLNKAFNTIYKVEPYWGFWKRRFVSMVLVIAAGAPMAISTVITVFAEQIERGLEKYLQQHYGLHLWWAWSTARWIIVTATLIAIATLLYRVGTEYKQGWRSVLPGAILATILWLMVTFFFNRYVQNFASYNRIYGSLGAVIVLLIWMFLTTLVLLYGAEFNYQYARQGRGIK
jgi:membrane protein